MLLKRGKESRKLITSNLKAGRIVVMACDTIYGIVGRVPDAEDHIREIKGRKETTPFLQLLATRDSLKSTDVILPDSDILNLWPGPFTFVLATARGGTSAYRIPGDSYLRSIISDVGFALYSTSVNRSGNPPLNNPLEILAEFNDSFAVVEDSGIFLNRKPSTVVDLTAEPFKILRQGAGTVPGKYL